MKLGLVRAPTPAPLAAPASKRSFTSTWETAVRRWLWDRSPSKSTNLDEVAHEVFIRFSGYNDATLMRCPQTFVLKVAANVVDEWCGTPRNEWFDEEEQADQPLGGAKKERHKSVNKTVAKRLQTAVNALSPRQRQVLLMHVNEELTYEQIAEKLRMAPQIVRKDLVRAYAHLRGDLGEGALDRP